MRVSAAMTIADVAASPPTITLNAIFCADIKKCVDFKKLAVAHFVFSEEVSVVKSPDMLIPLTVLDVITELYLGNKLLK